MPKRFFEHLVTSLIYESQNTFFSRLHPFTKIVYIMLTLVFAFIINTYNQLICILVVNVGITVIDKVIRRKFFMMLKGLFMFVVFIVLFNVIISYLLGDMDIVSALLYQLTAMLRIFAILPPVLVLVSTTTPMQIVQLLSRLGIKYYYLYPFVIAYRFIPTLFQEMRNVYDAQRSRGVELEKGGLNEKFKNLSSIIIPTIVCSFIRARDLSDALTLRGFGYKDKRTFYRQQNFSKNDVIFLCTILITYTASSLLIVL